jgi:hypothetical protein
LISLLVLVVSLSFSLAYAGDGVLKAAEEKGIKQNFYVWLPLVPRYAQYDWDAVLVLSNFTGANNFITLNITSYDKSTRNFFEVLGPFEKKSYGLSYFGFTGDVLTDMYITSNDVFAAIALLMDINTGEVQTSLPWFSNL